MINDVSLLCSNNELTKKLWRVMSWRDCYSETTFRSLIIRYSGPKISLWAYPWLLYIIRTVLLYTWQRRQSCRIRQTMTDTMQVFAHVILFYTYISHPKGILIRWTSISRHRHSYIQSMSNKSRKVVMRNVKWVTKVSSFHRKIPSRNKRSSRRCANFGDVSKCDLSIFSLIVTLSFSNRNIFTLILFLSLSKLD